jgi:hypothetical protein
MLTNHNFVVGATVLVLLHPHQLEPQEVRELIEEAGLDVRARLWDVAYVLIRGDIIAPHPEPGVLLVNGQACYSSSWL